MHRLARPLACLVAALAFAAVAGAIVAGAIAKSRGEDIPVGLGDAVGILLGVGTPACVGLVLVLRGAGVRVAWILLGGALSVAVVMAGFGLGSLALDHDPDSTAGVWGLVVGTEWTLLFLWPLVLAYVYPDGRLPSRRWRPMAAVAAVSAAGTLVLLPLQPTLEGPDGAVANPIGVGPGLEDLLTPVFWACWFGLLASLFGGALALRARYKAGGPELRRQVLWLAYGAVIPPLWLGGTSLINLFVSIDTPDLAVLMLAHAWFAIAVAVAVTRHGLYEIDRLFNRTLVYVVLTVLLAGTYALVALGAGQLVGGSAFACVARHARRGARVPPAARPPAGDRRPPLRAPALRGRAAAARLPRRRPRRPRGAGGRRRRARARARRPERRGGLPPPRDRRLRGPRRPPARRAARRRPRAHADRARRPRGRAAAPRPRRSRGGPISCGRCSTPRPSRSSSPACGSSCASSSPRSSPRGRGSPRPATPSAGGSSATSTTARSSGS